MRGDIDYEALLKILSNAPLKFGKDELSKLSELYMKLHTDGVESEYLLDVKKMYDFFLPQLNK